MVNFDVTPTLLIATSEFMLNIIIKTIPLLVLDITKCIF